MQTAMPEAVAGELSFYYTHVALGSSELLSMYLPVGVCDVKPHNYCISVAL